MDPILLTFHSRLHDPDLLARHVVRQSVGAHLHRWRAATGACELVYLATCQRVLWILWGGDGSALGLDPSVAVHTGEDAWRHLLEVATGLNSANLGDREVVGQLTGALDAARQAGTAGKEATAALEDILREARRLRTRIGLADGSASVATAAMRHLEARLKPGDSVALVGAGPMTKYLAERLPERGFRVAVANRTRAKAEALGAPTVPLERLVADPEGFDALVSATSSPEALFTLPAWQGLDRDRLVLLDLAMPCDTDPALASLPWIERTDLRDLLAETEQGRVRRREAALQAEPLIMGAVKRLRQRASTRIDKLNLRSAHDRLGEAWEALVAEALAPGGALSELTPDQREALDGLLRRGRTLAYRVLALQKELAEVS